MAVQLEVRIDNAEVQFNCAACCSTLTVVEDGSEISSEALEHEECVFCQARKDDEATTTDTAD